MRQLGEDAGRGCDRYGNASEMRGTCALICTYLDAQLCTSVCICRIDAAISDAPKPIGWLLWVRASYYLHVGRPAPATSTIYRHHTAQTAGTELRPGCTNVSPAAPQAAEKSELPPHTNPGKLEQKSEFPARPRVARIGPEIRIAGLLPARAAGLE